MTHPTREELLAALDYVRKCIVEWHEARYSPWYGGYAESDEEVLCRRNLSVNKLDAIARAEIARRDG